jgi:hypothetical protein
MAKKHNIGPRSSATPPHKLRKVTHRDDDDVGSESDAGDHQSSSVSDDDVQVPTCPTKHNCPDCTHVCVIFCNFVEMKFSKCMKKHFKPYIVCFTCVLPNFLNSPFRPKSFSDKF